MIQQKKRVKKVFELDVSNGKNKKYKMETI